MHGQIDIKHARLLSEVEAAVTELQPRLTITKCHPDIEISGTFDLSSSDGWFDEYQIRIVVFDGFPGIEPKVYETAGRIPRTADMHINTAGDCCLTVWEEWLVLATSTSFRDFLRGPMHEYFLNQWWFEKTGTWRFGQRSHGAKGIVEAYADTLEIEPKEGDVRYYLRLLSKDWPKGHWCCPCRSRKRLRDCHRAQLERLHRRIVPKMAKRMHTRLELHLGRERRRLP